MAASNSSPKEEIEHATQISCSRGCEECHKSFSDSNKIHSCIMALQNKLHGLQGDDQKAVLSWLMDFKRLDLQLLEYDPSRTKTKINPDNE
jgi:hypothetical protein